MTTPADLLAVAARRDAARPLLTWYDDATGERVELSVATAANWAAKTANHLVDEEIEAVRLEPAWHWLAVVVALGAWTAGVVVTDAADAEALPGDPQGFMASVLAQPDALMAPPPAPDARAVAVEGREWTLAELGAAAGHAAAHHGVAAGARVMSTLPLDTVDGLDASLLIPLAVDGSIVMVVHPAAEKLDRVAQTERVTIRLS